MQYKYDDHQNHCRWCGVHDETLDHIVNCGYDGHCIQNVEEIMNGTDLQQMREMAVRIEDFLERVDV